MGSFRLLASQNAPPTLEITSSRQFPAWLAEQKLSLALTTYQIGKLFLIGLKESGELSIFERSFNRCMGLCATANGLYLSSLYPVSYTHLRAHETKANLV